MDTTAQHIREIVGSHLNTLDQEHATRLTAIFNGLNLSDTEIVQDFVTMFGNMSITEVPVEKLFNVAVQKLVTKSSCKPFDFSAIPFYVS